ncbi:MAG: helix-turn-helix transcriptional regulator [Lewinellaceae bacterium]|nr:helix-turn-helix transcriptional regulator [Phaeodactylibacter sp.]MCB9038196.1 helix-turn-helix transcriptional regulator [Lewinellaceae bacterium]
MEEKKLNKIGDILREQGRTNKWLADKVGKSKVSVSRWCRNIQQPDLETLYRIANVLGVPVCDLLVEDYGAEDEKGK